MSGTDQDRDPSILFIYGLFDPCIQFLRLWWIMEVILSKEIYYGVTHHIGCHRSSAWLYACCVIKFLGWQDWDTRSIYLTHCGNSSKTLMKIAGLRAKNSNWLLLKMTQDSILKLVQSKEMTDQHQMPISFNLGKLPLLVLTSNTERIITKPIW